MVNHRPVARDYFDSTWDILEYPLFGDIVQRGERDVDGDLVRLNFVNGQRISRNNDPDNPATTVIQGQYGTLTVDENGGFHYELDFDNPTVQALEPGDLLIERFTFKISDGRGATDYGLLDLAIDVPDRGAFTIDFEDADRTFPYTYKGFSWGLPMDGDEMPLVTEANGNNYVSTGVFNTVILTRDGFDVIFEDLKVANSGWDGEMLVTFEGWQDDNLVDTMTVSVFGEDLAAAQHVSLSHFGRIDALRIEHEAVGYEDTPEAYPKLKLDDFSVIA